MYLYCVAMKNDERFKQAKLIHEIYFIAFLTRNLQH